MGHQCFFFAGESEWSDSVSYVVPEAHFEYPEVLKLTGDLFDDHVRSPETTRTVEKLAGHIKSHLYKFIARFDLNLLIVENAIAIPMNIPLGLAITALIAETSIATIGHHHDFSWERTRYSVGAADDYINAAFPPTLRSIQHVVINSYGQKQLALRTGASSVVVPNVMDFRNPPQGPDGYANDLKAALGFSEEECFLLQPTRIVPRKRIEKAIRLTTMLGMPAKLVISHASGDEGSQYAEFLTELIDQYKADVLFAADTFAPERALSEDGRKIYSLEDAYEQANLVTYPSTIEGFGNAFLEAIYFRKPIVMNVYDIYHVDIRPKGFMVVEFENFITRDTIEKTREVLSSPALSERMCEVNYQIASRHYSYEVLEKLLGVIVDWSRSDGFSPGRK
jgi:glycosyltransferase involved in cell wall biosynthesis